MPGTYMGVRTVQCGQVRLYLYLYCVMYTKVWRATSGRRTLRRAVHGGRAETSAGGGQAGAILCYGWAYISDRLSSSTPGVFYTCFYNHAHRLRLEKLSSVALSRRSGGYLKPLLDPGGGFTSETAARRFQN
jgi:hypothetical protein